MPRPIRPTLQDIADDVGVTKMTISRYLRSPDSVAPQTRAKIAVVIEKRGYIENRVPSMLSKSSSRAIGIVIPSLSNQVFAELVQGVESVTGKHGFDTLIAHTGYSPQVEEAKIEVLLSYQVDALILSETQHTPRTIKMLKQAGIPVVETMELPYEPIDMAVGLDHINVAYNVVSALLASGKHHIAYLAARLDTRTRLRQQGYENALADAGKSCRIVSTPEHSSFTLGATLMKQTLQRYPDTDAIFCTNDDLAVGAMMFCQTQAISIPSQLAIVGYNALDIGQAMTPKLTSVSTPRMQIGEQSAQMIFTRLRGENVASSVVDMGYNLTAGGTM